MISELWAGVTPPPSPSCRPWSIIAPSPAYEKKQTFMKKLTTQSYQLGPNVPQTPPHPWFQDVELLVQCREGTQKATEWSWGFILRHERITQVLKKLHIFFSQKACVCTVKKPGFHSVLRKALMSPDLHRHRRERKKKCLKHLFFHPSPPSLGFPARGLSTRRHVVASVAERATIFRGKGEWGVPVVSQRLLPS